MNTIETLQQFEQLTNHYLQELNDFSMEQLKQKPSEDEWSLGQMYVHLINAALYMQLRNVDQCMKQSDGSYVATGEKTEAGNAVFDQGGLPPVRIQVPPSPQYTPQQPESKEQLAVGLSAVMLRMKEIEPTLEKAQLQSTVSHPHFGALNAREWFIFVEMHYRHHLHQKKRLINRLEHIA